MMKRLLKVLSCFLAAVMATAVIATVVGCSCNEEDDPNEVKVIVWDSGWGVEVYEKAVAEFNKKGYDFKVTLDYSSDQTGMRGAFMSGTATEDVFLCPLGSSGAYQYLENLDDVVDSKWGTETKTIREKINNPDRLSKQTMEGHVVLLSDMAQFSGLVYNKALFASVGAEVPNTTDQLLDLCHSSTFNTTAHKAIIHFNDTNNGYYDYLFNAWVAQYNSYANWVNLTKLAPYSAYYGNEEVEYTDARKVLEAKDGRYPAFQVMRDMLYYDQVHASSNSADFTTAQAAFLNGQAMMMINGNWLGVEMMKNNGSFDATKFAIMRTPIISAIIDTIEDGSIEDDDELSAIIDEVDAGKTWEESAKTCTEAAYNRIVEARGMYVSGGNASGVHIPNYSNCIANAKEFVRYLFSDEVGLMWRELKYNDPGFYFDNDALNADSAYEGWGDWFKDNAKTFKAIKYCISLGFDCCGAYTTAGQDIILHTEYVRRFSATNSSDRYTADQVWQLMQESIETKWTTIAASL